MKKLPVVLIVAQKEFRTSLRDRIFLFLSVLIVCLTVAAYFTGLQKHADLQKKKDKAAQMFRHEWEHQEANPHSAAHFGTYLFKPDPYLSMYDQGLSNYLGIHYRVEAHIQHEVNQSVAEDTDSQLRFGELSVAMVFQLLVPLLILFVSFNAITKEREQQTMRILLVQGVKPSTILIGKLLGVYGLVLMTMIPLLLGMFIPVIMEGDQDMMIRYLLFSGSYLLYFLLFTVLFVWISALMRNSGASMVTGLALWLLLCIVIPRIGIRVIDATHPLPSRYELNRNISQGYTKGMDNDGTSTERAKKYLKATLEKYGVDTVTQLPINFDGLSMQLGEDYSSKVYDRFAGKVEEIIRQQQQALGILGLLNPYMAQQQLSMGLAGTDYYNHIAFHHQAKQYRDEFIRVLNLDMANSGSPYLSYDYKVGYDFFSKMKDFTYQPLQTKDVLRNHSLSYLSLLIWLLFLVLLIPVISKRVN